MTTDEMENKLQDQEYRIDELQTLNENLECELLKYKERINMKVTVEHCGICNGKGTITKQLGNGGTLTIVTCHRCEGTGHITEVYE